MLKQHVRLVKAGLYVTDITVTVLSFFLAYWIRTHHLTSFELMKLLPVEAYLWLLLAIVPVWTVLLYYFSAYKSYRTIPFSGELKVILKTVFVGSVVIGAIAFAFKPHYLSRSLIALFALINLVLLAAERYWIKFLSHSVRERGYNYRNVLIVGTNRTALNFLDVLERHGAWGLKMAGFVTDGTDVKSGSFSGHPIIGDVSGLEDIVRDNVVDEVVFATPRRDMKHLEETFLMLEDNGINARVALDIFPHAIARVRIEEIEDIPFLTFSTVPANSLALTVKRVFDVFVSSLILILALPIIVVTAVSVKLSSAGPVFFAQTRSGMNGRSFTLYKFRSMSVDAESEKSRLEDLNESDGPVFLMVNDPRVTTRVGRFIRRTSIDELPQLWNVLKGDMSLIGPRPPLPVEVAKYKRWQRRRISMKPGIVCLWQVSGNYVVKDFDDWVRMDLQYNPLLSLSSRTCHWLI